MKHQPQERISAERARRSNVVPLKEEQNAGTMKCIRHSETRHVDLHLHHATKISECQADAIVAGTFMSGLILPLLLSYLSTNFLPILSDLQIELDPSVLNRSHRLS